MDDPVAGHPTSVARRAVRGVAWTLPTSLGARAVGLVGTLVLARFLAPAEYGEVAAAATVVWSASSVTVFGVGLYLVTRPSVTRAEVFLATCWFLGVGVAALAGTWALSGALGAWVGSPGLRRFVPVLVVSALLDRIGYVPERMAIRELRFARISLARALGELTYTAVSILLAFRGLGAMAVAWGIVARSSMRLALTLPAVGWREWLEPHRLRLATFLDIFGFGATVALTSIATFAMRRWDSLLVSRYFGAGTMGAYDYAYNLADTPATAIGEQMTDVVTASFRHFDPQARAAALVRSCTMLSLIMLPLAFGLGAVAHTLVQAFLPESWAAVAAMLQVLCVLSAARPLALVAIGYLYVSDRRSLVMWLEVLSLAAVLIAIPTVSPLGLGWTCGAVSTVFVLRMLGAMWFVRRLEVVGMSGLLSPVASPFVACLVMVATILAVRPFIQGLPPAPRLVIEIGVGGCVYLASAALLFRSQARQLLGAVRSALAK